MAEDRYTRITLRIPKKTHKALQEAADARSHSMNAEIVQRLEDSLSPQDPSEIISSLYERNIDEKHIELQLSASYQSLIAAKEEYNLLVESEEAEVLERAMSLYEIRRCKRSFLRYFRMAKRKEVNIPSEMDDLARSLS